MIVKAAMFEGMDAKALALANSAILVQLPKAMDGAKRNALIDAAAESLEKGTNPMNVAIMGAVRSLRGEWLNAPCFIHCQQIGNVSIGLAALEGCLLMLSLSTGRT